MNISKYITLEEATLSQKAKENNVTNIPNDVEIENMKFVAVNVFDKCREHFKGALGVNSFFRSKAVNTLVGGSSTSDHMKGLSIDINAKKYGTTTNAELFKYIAKNLEFDQLIWEHGTKDEPSWIHVSLKKIGNRKQILRAVKENVKVGSKIKTITKYYNITKDFAD